VLFLKEAEDVELSNSRGVNEIGLDEIPLTSSGNSPMLHLLTMEVSPFDMISNLNRVLIAAHFNKGGYGNATSCIIILHPGLQEFLEKCLM
jgi:hypothetical protein